MPASESIRSVLSSCHVMRNRPGTPMRAAAPYDLQASPAAPSAAGFHAFRMRSASRVTGTRP